jgi:hypothetical protein
MMAGFPSIFPDVSLPLSIPPIFPVPKYRDNKPIKMNAGNLSLEYDLNRDLDQFWLRFAVLT